MFVGIGYLIEFDGFVCLQCEVLVCFLYWCMCLVDDVEDFVQESFIWLMCYCGHVLEIWIVLFYCIVVNVLYDCSWCVVSYFDVQYVSLDDEVG